METKIHEMVKQKFREVQDAIQIRGGSTATNLNGQGYLQLNSDLNGSDVN